MDAHLHFQVNEKHPTKNEFTGIVDPFNLGIDGGRPAYWDTKTNNFKPSPDQRKVELEFVLEVLPTNLMNAEIDGATKRQLLELRSRPQELRTYLGRRVLEKTKGPDGTKAYEFLPGSDMYNLMHQIYSLTRTNHLVVHLPFPHPMLLSFYRAYNPIDL